ncbi:MAG TPA: DMT family protein [Candidatus Binataceae bacterium]|nr:DMT family protein [Candidatus Binataceae bacterium]
MWTVILLFISNTFMTFAWYGHLKHRSAPLPEVVVVSWLIAFGEYCFQVPANRIGYGQFTAYQLKIIQECITIVVFIVIAYLYLGEPLRWNYAVSFGLIAAAAAFAFYGMFAKL